MYQNIPAIESEKCSQIQGGIKSVFTFSQTQVFKDGVLYADILERNGYTFKVKIISENKYLNGITQYFTIHPGQ